MNGGKKKGSLLVVAMLALALAPLVSNAAHCAEIFIGTGSYDGELPGSGAFGRPNLGGFGGPCPDDGQSPHLDTNVITPGSTFVRVGAYGTAAQPASNGKIKFNDGAFQDFEWTHDDGLYPYWLSPIIAIPAGTTRITASGTTTNTGPPVPQTVTYRAAGS